MASRWERATHTPAKRAPNPEPEGRAQPLARARRAGWAETTPPLALAPLEEVEAAPLETGRATKAARAARTARREKKAMEMTTMPQGKEPPHENSEWLARRFIRAEAAEGTAIPMQAPAPEEQEAAAPRERTL